MSESKRDYRTPPESGKPLEQFEHLGHTFAFTVNDFRVTGEHANVGVLISTNDQNHLIAAMAAQSEWDENLYDLMERIATAVKLRRERRAGKS